MGRLGIPTLQAYGAAESDYRPERWKSFREDYRFTGKEEDIEVGLQYFGFRYYSPYLGRWASADPLAVHSPGEADLNVYAYVEGQGLKMFDVVGLSNDHFQKLVGETMQKAFKEKKAVSAEIEKVREVSDHFHSKADRLYAAAGDGCGGPCYEAANEASTHAARADISMKRLAKYSRQLDSVISHLRGRDSIGDDGSSGWQGYEALAAYGRQKQALKDYKRAVEDIKKSGALSVLPVLYIALEKSRGKEVPLAVQSRLHEMTAAANGVTSGAVAYGRYRQLRASRYSRSATTWGPGVGDKIKPPSRLESPRPTPPHRDRNKLYEQDKLILGPKFNSARRKWNQARRPGNVELGVHYGF